MIKSLERTRTIVNVIINPMCQCESLVDLKPPDTGMEAILKKHDAEHDARLGNMCPDLCILQKKLTSLK